MRTRTMATSLTLLLLAMAMLAGPASAQESVYPPTEVGGIDFEKEPGVEPVVDDVEVRGISLEAGEQLAITGGDLLVLSLAGLVLLGLGVVAVRGVRRPVVTRD